MFIDTHTHYNDPRYAEDLDAVISRAAAAGVGKMIQADIDGSERESMFAVTKRYPGMLYNMLGLYPGSVDAGWRDEMDAMTACKDRGAVAIGEIGLDYHEGGRFREEQKEAFRVQLELASQWDLPVNIHLRDALEDFLKIIKDSARLHLRGNLHCYGGSYETFREVRKYGDWYVGIGGVVTFKNASVAEAVKKIPLDRILLETDCPYLAPVPYRGQRNESSYIPIIAAKIAELKGTDIAEIEATTTSNALKLFGI